MGLAAAGEPSWHAQQSPSFLVALAPATIRGSPHNSRETAPKRHF
jgi:hypothetical protein